MKTKLLFICIFGCLFPLFAQNEEEDDYSEFDDFDFSEVEVSTFANAKINGLSPQRLISVGYDAQAGYDLTAGGYGIYGDQTARINATHGYRVGANIPVYSTNKLIVQLGGQIWDMNYEYENPDELNHPLHQTLSENGLTTLGLVTTVYKPLNDKAFLLFQGNTDMNGDFELPDAQSLDYLKYSAALLIGKRPSDYKQWALGISRTYRAGESNIVPIAMFNWTSLYNNWGVELLLPARGHVRYTFNKRSIMMAGFELEGNSYRLGNNGSNPFNDLADLELRRSEIRTRLMYQRQVTGFIWLAAELGYRINYRFDVDEVGDEPDFSRYFVLDTPYKYENEIGNPVYFNLSLNLVSP